MYLKRLLKTMDFKLTNIIDIDQANIRTLAGRAS
jgi:hypothetical protein